MKTRIPPVLITFTLVCFAPIQNTRAVSPAPDGGYPGGNTAEGQKALLSLTTGGFNTAVGWLSVETNSTGRFNTGVGAGTLALNTENNNTATGAGALLLNTTGSNNVANGVFALLNNTTGTANTVLGAGALFHNTTGNGNIGLGSNSGLGVSTGNDVICIGQNVAGANVDGTCFIGNIRGVTTQNADAIPVLIDSGKQLGTASSSRRYKTDIKSIDKASECLLELKPVSFRYKVHKDSTPQFGLIAEDVAEVNPNLVIYDADGKPYTVRYDSVNAMLLNEFLKEHRKVEEQGATIANLKSAMAQQRKDFETTTAQQQKQIEALAAGLQRMSAQLELRKPAPQTVLNNQ